MIFIHDHRVVYYVNYTGRARMMLIWALPPAVYSNLWVGQDNIDLKEYVTCGTLQDTKKAYLAICGLRM